MPDAWTRFVRSIDDVSSPTALESLDVGALAELTPPERLTAETLLCARLAVTDDPRVIPALVTLGSEASWNAIVTAMRDLRPSAHTRTAAAIACLARGHRGDAVASLVTVARHPGASSSLRLQALHALPASYDAEALLAHLAADPDGIIRATAFRALVERLGWSAFLAPPSPLAALGMRLGSTFGTERATAINQLRKLLDGAAAGVSPETLLAADPRRPR